MKTLRLYALLILVLISGVSFLVYPQNSYTLLGKVVDAKSGELLPGATVMLLYSNNGVVTDLNGNFTLTNIAQSYVTVKVTYIGYESKEVNCDFSRSNTLDITVKLSISSKEIEELIVQGRADGKIKARLEQKLAENIKNVVSAEQIDEFPDVNAAEVIQRIPGITLQRDQGEGRYIQLRGTPPELTNFNINGEQIPSPEGDVRYVGLDIIAADQIDYIEVTKVLTPDMDADGIAGNVNIVTKMAMDSVPEINLSVVGGYNNILKTYNQQLQFSLGQRIGKFGMQFNASYYNNDQGSHNMEYDYTRGPVLGDAQSDEEGDNADNFYVLYEDVEYRHYTINRKRLGVTANFDFTPNEDNLLYLKGMYNRFADDETRLRKTHGLSDANDELTYRSTGLEFDFRDRLQIQDIASINFGGEHTILNHVNLDYEYSYAYASEETPNYISAGFDRGLIGLYMDKTDPEWPVVRYINEEDSLNAHNYESMEFDGMRKQEIKVLDINHTAKFNIEIPYRINAKNKGYIKFGGKVRLKDKLRDKNAIEYSKYDESVRIYSQKGPELNVTTVAGDFNETNLLNHGYTMTSMPDPQKFRDFFEAHPQNFRISEQDTWKETYQEDYWANERIYAGYLMFHHDFNNLMVVGGARYEKTVIDYETQLAWLELEVDSLRGQMLKNKSRDQREFPYLLPNVQIKYAINGSTNIRAAFTKTYTRPNFDDILPYRREKDNGDVVKGNPNLKYPLALNIDLLGESYIGSSVFSGGLFYKKIDHFVFNYVRRAHEGENFNVYGLKEITMPVNGQSAFVYGGEFQAEFMLPGYLRNFGIYATYTFTNSEAIISKRFPQNENDIIYTFDDFQSDFFTSSGETEIIPLPGQAKHTANLALIFDYKGFYAKLSGNYHSEFLDELGNDSGLDTYYDQIMHLDFTANYDITPKLNCFVNAINLTNEPLRYYMGSRDYFKQQEYYSWSLRLGLKYEY